MQDNTPPFYYRKLLPLPPALRGVPRYPLPPDEVHVDPQLFPPGQVQGVPGQGVQVHHQAVPAGQAAGTAEQYSRDNPGTVGTAGTPQVQQVQQVPHWYIRYTPGVYLDKVF